MLLEVDDLNVSFGRFKAVDNLSLRVGHGATLGIILGILSLATDDHEEKRLGRCSI